MPSMEQNVSPNRAWGLWKIEESEQFFHAHLPYDEPVPATITHSNKRLEYLAARYLLKTLMDFWGINLRGIYKNRSGKPFLVDYPHELSLSHSYPYVAAVVDKKKPVGIDLEQAKMKLLRIAPRVLSAEELMDAGNDPVKHCVYWCAKEAMLKVHGEKNLSFSENLGLMPFSVKKEGDLIGRIIAKGNETVLPLHYRVTKDFVMVYTI